MKQTTTKTDSFFSGFLGFFFSRLSSLTSKGIDQLRKKGDQQTTATDPQIVLAVFGHLAVILSATGCFFWGRENPTSRWDIHTGCGCENFLWTSCSLRSTIQEKKEVAQKKNTCL